MKVTAGMRARLKPDAHLYTFSHTIRNRQMEDATFTVVSMPKGYDAGAGYYLQHNGEVLRGRVATLEGRLVPNGEELMFFAASKNLPMEEL